MSNDFDYFKQFMPAVQDASSLNREVWSYTRVSSKEQFEKNSSVGSQISVNNTYAVNFKYQVIREFGGTYESAKSDFTRKEFKRLIDEIEQCRKKPYAILVFKMSRFSRSGGNAIGLVNYLVETLGVNLIETSSGINTTTERGKAAVYESLFHAYKENLERKEVILPNMKLFLEKGYRLGNAPLGYDHYGPRVRRENHHSAKQRIIINDTGIILREAWKWKASGLYSDAQIKEKLAARGVVMSKQLLSAMWRRPFYCGISINKLLDTPMKGNWEPLVSIEEFKKVQGILDNNNSGYQHSNENDKRPLTHLVKCDACGNFLLGYEVKKKGLHYYRCLKCNGVSVNANSTPKSRRVGANELFSDFLTQFTLDEKYIPVLKLQIEKIFGDLNNTSIADHGKFENRLRELLSQQKQMKIRFGLGEIDKETYQLTSDHLNTEIQKINRELDNGKPIISNLENVIENSLKKASNINRIWASSDTENKKNLCRILFPGGVYYNAENHTYLTREVNKYFALITTLSNDYGENKKETSSKISKKSLPVPESRLELPTFGL